MDRNFALLGLRDDATKEQVKAAYERRLARYKSANYADDPEYAKRKINQLTAAYEKAYAAASGAPSVKKPAVSAAEARRHELKKKKHREYERRRKEIDEEERHPIDLLRRSREEEDSDREKTSKIQKPNLVSLKEKATELKERAVETSQEIQREFSSTNTGSSTNKEAKEAAAKIAVAIVIALFSIMFTMCDGSDDFDYDYDDYSDVDYYYDISDYSDEDYETYSLVFDVSSALYDLEYDVDWEETENDEEELRKLADEFASAYTDDQTIADLCDRLYQEYIIFPENGNSDIYAQLKEVLHFYGFPGFYGIQGLVSPYTERPISNETDYLNYLISWKEEYDNQ